MKPLKTWYNNTTHEKLELYYDQNPDNPRTEWDNTTTMVCWREFQVAEQSLKRDFSNDFEELQEFLEDKFYLFLQRTAYGISAYDKNHTVKEAEYCYTDGVIFISRKDANEFYPDTEDIYEVLRSDVKTMNAYLEGNVYGYKLYERDQETDSCWGIWLDKEEEILEHAGIENPTQWSDSDSSKIEYESYFAGLYENAKAVAESIITFDRYKTDSETMQKAHTLANYFLTHC